jgi:hypothetical protein
MNGDAFNGLTVPAELADSGSGGAGMMFVAGQKDDLVYFFIDEVGQ